MTPRNQALERVAQAARRVENAAGQWNAVDLSLLGDCVSALEASILDLSGALTILEGSDQSGGDQASPVSHLRANLFSLKKSVGRLERLVDSSAAFLRSAPGLACDRPALYQADGVICQAASFSEMGGMQG